MLIDDKSVASPKTLKVVNPSTEEVISEFPSGTIENVDPAVMDAGRAQESSAVLTTIRRAGCLRQIATPTLERKADLGF